MENIKIHRRLIDLDNIQIFYRDTETHKDPILCLHGRWGRGETWVDFINNYGKRFRIVAPDQRGHGLSSKPESEYSGDEMTNDMIHLLDHLGIKSAIVIGHSMGGYIAGYMAAMYPQYVKALAILDKSASGPKAQGKPKLNQMDLIDPVTRDWPMPFTSLKEAQDYIRNEMESELSYQYFMNSLVETIDGYQMMFSTQAIASNIAQYKDWYDLLPRIQCPTMILRAKHGDAVSDDDFARMKSMIINCMDYEIDTTDHNVHLADKEAFYKCMDDFLKKIG